MITQKKTYVIQYRVRGTSELQELVESNIKEAYRFLGSIRRFCSHTEIQERIQVTGLVC